jgi:hypothetical protein
MLKLKSVQAGNVGLTHLFLEGHGVKGRPDKHGDAAGHVVLRQMLACLAISGNQGAESGAVH